MITISLCMIVKNEEDVLARCLQSLQPVVDEIIIVDTGSNDKTKEIAAQYTQHVYDFPWVDDFSKARNFAFSKATQQYCMWVDADDVISPMDQFRLKALKDTAEPTVDVFMLKYDIAFDEEDFPTFSYYRERIIKNHSGFVWEGAVHEAITPRGNIEYKEIAIQHRKLHVSDSDRNLRILEKQPHLSPREQYYYGRELYYHGRYKDAIQVFDHFLKGGQGWIENNIDACKIRGLCYQKLGLMEEELNSYLQSLSFDIPRGELCCAIGNCFFQKAQYKQAIYWYQNATTLEIDETSGAFIEKDYYDFIPYLQLCVCFDKLGDKESAKNYNDLAAFLKPNHPSVLYNKEYFNQG